MDHEAIGRKIVLDCWPQFSWWPKEELAKIGRAAVEAVNKALPVATAHAVARYVQSHYNNITGSELNRIVEDILAAIRHFAAPERVEMMIEGASVIQLDAAMWNELNIAPDRRSQLEYDTVRTCAVVAHRLATTPKPPAVDPDARAKKMWGAFMRGINPHSTATDDEFWNFATQGDRAGIRAVVAAMEGK
jgi:hypothetical protein